MISKDFDISHFKRHQGLGSWENKDFELSCKQCKSYYYWSLSLSFYARRHFEQKIVVTYIVPKSFLKYENILQEIKKT